MPIPTFSHREKLALPSCLAICLLQGEDESGNAGFAYVAIHGSQLDAFMKALIDGQLPDISAYGKILREGPGEPSDDDRDYMQKTHRFNHDALDVYCHDKPMGG